MRRHLEGCATCREELESVRQQLRLLRLLEAPEPPEFPDPSTLPPPPPPLAPIRSAMRRRPVAAGVLLFAFLFGLALAGRCLPADLYRLVTVVDVRPAAGATVPLLVQVTERATGHPAPGVTLAVALGGSPTLTGTSDAEGLLEVDLSVPAGDVVRRLRVVARSSLGRSVLEQALVPGDSHRLVLSTDRFRYRPGEAVAVRAALVPAARGSIRLELLGPDGLRRWLREVEPGFGGAAWTQVPLDPGESLGMHLLVASASGARAVTPVEVGEGLRGARGLRLVVPRGTLAAGVDNEVLAVAPGYRGTVSLECEGQALEAPAGPFGVARFLVRPRRRSVTLRAEARGLPAADLVVPVQESPAALVLGLEPLSRAGEVLPLQVRTAGPPGTVVAELRQGGQTLVRAAGRLDQGQARLRLLVPPEAWGPAEVRVFRLDPEAEFLTLDARRVLIEARPWPFLEMVAESAEGGAAARVRLQFLDTGGDALPAVVGLEAAPPAVGRPSLEEALALPGRLPGPPAEAAAALLEGASDETWRTPPGQAAVAALLAEPPVSGVPDLGANPSILGEARLDRVVRQGWSAVLIVYVVALMAMILTDLGRSPWAILPVGICFLAVLPGLAEPSEIDYRPAVMAAFLLGPLLAWASSLTLADVVDGRPTLFVRTALAFVVLLSLLSYGMEAEAGLLDWGLALLVATGLSTALASLVDHREEAGPLAALAALGLVLTAGILVFACLVFPGTLGPELLMLFAQASGVVAWAARADAPWPSGMGVWEPALVLLFGGTLLAVVLSPHGVRSRAQGQLTACLANLRAMESALASYASDHDRKVPPNLRRLVPRYLRQMSECPAAGRDTYSAGYLPRDGMTGFVLCCRGHNHGDVGMGADRPQVEGGVGAELYVDTAPPPVALGGAAPPGWRPDIATGRSGRVEVVFPVLPATKSVQALVTTVDGRMAWVQASLAPAPGPGTPSSGFAEDPAEQGDPPLRAEGVREAAASPGVRLEVLAGGVAERDAVLPAHPEGGPKRLRVFLGAASQIARALDSIEPGGASSAAARLEMAALGLQTLQAEGIREAGRVEEARRALEGAAQALLTFGRPDGSFAVTPGGVGDIDLTIEALRALGRAARVAPVEPRAAPEAARWLALRQDLDGAWGGGVERTARAAQAFLGAQAESEALRRAHNWLSGRLPSRAEDLLAAAAFAVEADPHGPWASRLLDRVRPLVGDSNLAVEVLARSPAGKDELVSGLDGMARRRRADGGFGDVQATLAAARALAAASGRFDPSLRVAAGPEARGLKDLEPGPWGGIDQPVEMVHPLVLRLEGAGLAAWQVLEEAR